MDAMLDECCCGQVGDFDSLEYAQALVGALPRLEVAGIALQALGVGDAAGADRFCQYTGFPRERLAVETTPQLHAQLGLYGGVQAPGIPWARACFVIGTFSFWPFGQEAVSRRELTGQNDCGTGPLGLIGNVIWFVVAGWWLAIGHLTSAVACFITIIGIPFGIQHIKLALIALAPIGLQVVPLRRR